MSLGHVVDQLHDEDSLSDTSTPIRQGRKDWFVWRCWCREDCLHHGVDQQRGQGSWWLLCVCREMKRKLRGLRKNEKKNDNKTRKPIMKPKQFEVIAFLFPLLIYIYESTIYDCK